MSRETIQSAVSPCCHFADDRSSLLCGLTPRGCYDLSVRLGPEIIDIKKCALWNYWFCQGHTSLCISGHVAIVMLTASGDLHVSAQEDGCEVVLTHFDLHAVRLVCWRLLVFVGRSDCLGPSRTETNTILPLATGKGKYQQISVTCVCDVLFDSLFSFLPACSLLEAAMFESLCLPLTIGHECCYTCLRK